MRTAAARVLTGESVERSDPELRLIPSDDIDAMRVESRAAIRELAGLLGYPESWGDELERRQFASGKIWRRKHETPSWPG